MPSRRSFLQSAAAGAVAATVSCGPEIEPSSVPSGTISSRDLQDRFDPWIEVEADALAHNVSEIRRITENRPIIAVIKNNAYGLGLISTAELLEAMPEIAGFAVVKSDAAIALKEAGIQKPVHLMAMFPESLAPELARLGVMPCLYSEDALRFIEPMVQAVGGPVDVQVYLDTGMSRMGIPYHQALPWLESIVESGMVRLRGMFMGFTEDPEYDREQLRRFLAVADQAAAAGFSVGTLHAASSSGVFELPEAHLDMVRPGLAIFGGYPNDPARQRQKATLRSTVSLKARVVRVQELRVGDSVSYGRNYVAQQPTWVATIPVGHTDGYPRKAVDGGRVLIGDGTYPVIGAVSASHTIVELGSSPAVAVGDVATLVGSAAEEVDPNWLSAETGASVYDIFMHLNPLLPRVVV
jgi:alanine racemase